jgi:CheY-like chemotaxis protein
MPTLLLSDDSVTVQRMVAMTFAGEGITVTTVNDGEEAIARIAWERPDIVLAGIATPRRNGYDVATFVKSTPELASIPVLLLAGAFDPVDQARADQVRCDGVLVKPFEPQQVVARVKALIAAAKRTPGEGVSGASRPTEPAVSSTVVPPKPESEAAAPTLVREKSLDDYFDRLDAAISTRASARPTAGPDEGVAVPTLESVLEPVAAAEPRTPGSGAVASDALVEEVTRRVIERLGSQAVREVVAGVVADVAERLIREEIARIRNQA